ncbi:hypothetical protein ACFL2U_00110 [Patescibacteria group bacterium]
MKKLIILAFVVFACYFTMACNVDDCDSGDCNINYNPVLQEDILSEILIVVSPNQFNGSLANVMIWADEDRSDMVVDETESIFMDGQVLSYFLEPGDYWLNIISPKFTSYKHFTILPGKNMAIEVELLDAYTVEWIINNSNNSPSTGVISPETHLLWFEVSQNWLEMLYLHGFLFQVDNPGDAVTIDTCKIQIYTLAGWSPMSLPAGNSCTSPGCYNYHFTVDNGMIDPYWYIHPNSPHLFAFVCEVTAAQPGSVIKVNNMGFGFKNSYLLPFSVSVPPEGPDVTF